MKRAVLLFAILLTLSIPHKYKKLEGYINLATGAYWCSNSFSCLHEQAHLIDLRNRWISETDEYQIALLVYVVDNKAGIDNRILTSLIKEPRERYANVFAIFGGNVPDSLKPFYPGPQPARYVIKLPKGALNVP